MVEAIFFRGEEKRQESFAEASDDHSPRSEVFPLTAKPSCATEARERGSSRFVRHRYRGSR